MSEYIEQFWRDADGADVMRVMDGQTVEARFRDKGDKEWKHEFLSGWSKIDELDWLQWASSEGAFWGFCQVYDPPEWFVNKPDPGEGWRLLERFPDEDKLATDEYWSNVRSQWRVHKEGSSGKQFYGVWYRRRIETKPTQCVGRVCNLAQSTGVTCPHDSCDLQTGVRIANNPVFSDSSTAENSSETPNSSRSRDTIPSGWHVLGKDEERLASDAYWSPGAKDWIIIGDDRVKYANELPRWHAIRRIGSFDLVVGFNYTLPSGKEIRVTEKGFEVV